MSSSNRADVRDFLVTRRAHITPQQAGLPFYGGNRRVPGLRREEVAMLAGVSADYYPSHDGLRLLASWAATQGASSTASTPGH
jgi:hypothetical protein